MMKVITCLDKEPTHIVWDSDDSSASEAESAHTSLLSTAASSGGDSDDGAQIRRRAKPRGDRKFHRPNKADFFDMEPQKVTCMSRESNVDYLDMEPLKVDCMASAPYFRQEEMNFFAPLPSLKADPSYRPETQLELAAYLTKGLPLAPPPYVCAASNLGAEAPADTFFYDAEDGPAGVREVLAMPIEDNASDTPPSTEAEVPTTKSKRTRPSKGKRQQGKRLAQGAFEQYGTNVEACVEKLRGEGASPATLAYACKVLGCLRSEAAPGTEAEEAVN